MYKLFSTLFESVKHHSLVLRSPTPTRQRIAAWTERKNRNGILRLIPRSRKIREIDLARSESFHKEAFWESAVYQSFVSDIMPNLSQECPNISLRVLNPLNADRIKEREMFEWRTYVYLRFHHYRVCTLWMADRLFSIDPLCRSTSGNKIIFFNYSFKRVFLCARDEKEITNTFFLTQPCEKLGYDFFVSFLWCRAIPLNTILIFSGLVFWMLLGWLTTHRVPRQFASSLH